MWKEFIKGYSVSDSGEVRNNSTGRILKQSVNNGGFYRVTIKNRHYSIHRLVAIAFVPNPNNLPNVIFKDSDKENITSRNLQWISEHNKYALHSAMKRTLGNIKIDERAVKIINYSSNFDAKHLAWRYNVSISTIYAIRKGKNIKRFD